MVKPGDWLANARLRASIVREVLAERERQHRTYGQQQYRDHATYSREEFQYLELLAQAERQINADPELKSWPSILLEQVYGALGADELAGLRAGLIQSAAVIAAWVEDIDTRTPVGGGGDGS